jgi:hypothetical protein
MQTCNLSLATEWLSDESLEYVSECLRCCENPEMVYDLRQIFPRQALIEATKLVGQDQRKRLHQWVVQINQQAA